MKISNLSNPVLHSCSSSDYLARQKVFLVQKKFRNESLLFGNSTAKFENLCIWHIREGGKENRKLLDNFKLGILYWKRNMLAIEGGFATIC